MCTAAELYGLGPGTSESERKRNIIKAIRRTAGRLGNTPAACRSYYVHPVILEAYRDGALFETMKEEERLGDGGAKGLSREERCVVRLLAAGNPYPQPKPSVASCG